MKLLEAISFATKKHNGQVRKVDNIPYISHPYRVAMLLSQEGVKEDVVIAGLLHDVVEDTDGTLEEIETLFGSKVSTLVEYASEPDKSLSWEERKKHTIETIRTAPIEAKLVVCADKVDNLTSILENEKEMGAAVWDSFKRDKVSQQWYYTNVYTSLTDGVQAKHQPKLFDTFKRLLDQFI
ncbi:HD domain-containing protein [Aquibacillus koreensis]|uniref:HD domain-containing protein n=1 Tax=Aquibacillus koreensis TaxID=279446 RepID=A0A9X3WRQ3_9BACI|nr:HD domain-containing protein [Aquibacillus koreensis]MCT2534932.1 HD domain-containing protein [Aquibacillus koreensis]MDC3422174.1 HD domain-containing protein [Aquibacillus koreensis]